ncbi:MAG: DUF1080 domain-containing protein [Phycisphaerae bacterium]|nr:DUF1080 domain-containing protein [Phycisphaerae bacterium]
MRERPKGLGLAVPRLADVRSGRQTPQGRDRPVRRNGRLRLGPHGQSRQWYDITFHAPKFDAAGKMTKKGRLTVVQNGIAIIDDKEIPGTTPGGVDEDPRKKGLQYDVTKPGPLMLQDHGNEVAFRNIWLVPLDAK